MKKQLFKFKTWSVNCGYPEHIISKAFHDGALQSPAPYQVKNNTWPFVTIYSNNYYKSLVTNIRKKINNSNLVYLKEVFKYSFSSKATQKPTKISY